MNRSRPSRTPSNLSDSILQQLNMYALAASAAGVGLLALAQPAESKVVYTKAHKVMGTQSLVELDLNHDGISDFLFYQACSGGHVVCLFVHDSVDGSKIWSSKGINGQSYAAALRAGVRIGPSPKRPSRKPPKGGLDMAFYTCTSLGCAHGGPWYNVRDRFLGLKFSIHGKPHYGWARLNVRFDRLSYTAVLTGYAYETIPGKSIKTGQTTSSADVSDEEDFGPSASLTNPIPDTPQPASLGMLALGAQGVPWRRKESAGVTVENN